MTRAHYFVLMLAFAFCTGIVSAQVPTGTPPFGSFGGDPDIISLANLNAHLDIPVLHKPGRGTNFTYDLSYDSSVWFPVSSGSTISWQPVSNWGWLAQSSALTGSVPIRNTTGSCFVTGPSGLRLRESYPITIYTGYQDPFGTFHAAGVTTTAGDPNCDSGPVPPVHTGSQQAIDGSGYILTVNETTNNPRVLVTRPTGVNLANPGTSTATVTDTNGNQLTTTTGATTTFTDTLGTTALTVAGAGTPTSPMTYTYTAPSGASPYYQMNYTQYTVKTYFNISGIAEYGPTSVPLVSSIVLPDNSQYTFSYEATPAAASCTPLSGTTSCVTGRITNIVLPTGGQITYSYSGGSNGIFSDGSTATLGRTINDGSNSNTWSYAQVKGTGAASTTTVTDPQGNNTVIQFQGIYETQRQVSGLLTTNTCYNGATSPCNGTAITLPITQRAVITTLPNNLQSKHFNTFNTFGLPTESDDYDYGPGAPSTTPLRKITIAYAALGNNINGFPKTVTVYNATTQVAQTNYNYDETTPTTSPGTPQHVSVSGSRGNLTSIDYPAGGLVAHFTYYDTGTMNTATDVNGAVTTNSYAGSSCGNSFPTSVSEPLSLSRSMTWNCTGGVQLTGTDENNRTVTNTYNDPYFWRPASITDQLTNITQFGYQVSPPGMWQSLTFNGGQSVANIGTGLDGLGRVINKSHIQAPGATAWDQVIQSYDTNGRPWKTSMPCVSTGPWTCPITGQTTTYDALNRPVVTTDGGGGTVGYTYTGNDVYVTIGPAPSGENSKRRQLEYDALGRLTSVCEITTATGSGACGQNVSQNGFLTKYAYDALNNLTGVRQNGQVNANCTQQQSRCYSYDAMSRLTSETNPEAGTTIYTYETDPGCGISAGDVVKRTDAVGNQVCYTYDALHRLTTVLSYGPYAAATPSKFYKYDAATVDTVVMTNAKARLAEAYTSSSPTGTPKLTDTGFSYSPRGEITGEYQSTPNSGGYYTAFMAYWANGVPSQIASNINNFPVSINYGVDGEGRPYQVSASSGQNPVTSTTFNPASLTTAMTYGSGDSDSITYDPNTNRMTHYQFTTNGSSLTGTLSWNANGTLQNQNIDDSFNVGGTQNCAYQYDDVSRIGSANCGGNQLQNPGFESGNVDWSLGGNWSIVNNSSNAQSGNWYLSGSSTTDSGSFATPNGSQWMAVTPGEVVTYGGWIKRVGGTGNIAWDCEMVDANYNLVAWCPPAGTLDTSGGTSWQFYQQQITVSANSAYMRFYAEIHGYGDTDSTLTSGYFDSAQLDGAPIAAQTFAYDAFGNINKSGSPYSFQPTYSSSTNRMTNIGSFTPTYDGDGNVTNDGLHTYSWDAYGRPVAIDSVNLTYDALGRMVEQNRSGAYTQIVYAPTSQKLAVMNGQTLQKAFVPLPGGGQAVYASSGLLYYGHTDHLGSFRYASTPSRTMYFDVSYAPFGETYASSGSTDPAFTGQRQDTVSGLYDFPAREYSIQGRWPSPDPAGFLAADYTNPQTWNAYAYALNNPVNFIDPLGLFTCGSIWVSCGPPAGGGGYDGYGGLGSFVDVPPPLLYKGHGSGGGGDNSSAANNAKPTCFPTSSLNWSQKAELKAAQIYASLTGWTFGFGAGLDAGAGVGPKGSSWNVGLGGSASTLIVADPSGNSGFLNSASGGFSAVKMSSAGSWWGAGAAAGPSVLVSPFSINTIAGPSFSASGGGGAVLGAGANVTTSGAATITFGVGAGAEGGISGQFGASQFIPFCHN